MKRRSFLQLLGAAPAAVVLPAAAKVEPPKPAAVLYGVVRQVTLRPAPRDAMSTYVLNGFDQYGEPVQETIRVAPTLRDGLVKHFDEVYAECPTEYRDLF